MIFKLFKLFVILFILIGTSALASKISVRNLNPEIIPFLKLTKIQPINQASLPKPYDLLLTQNLMTPTLEKYYRGKAIIQSVYTKTQKQTYSRAIVMLFDINKKRNNPELALFKKEVRVAEFAFITMNFTQLPKALIQEVKHSSKPFGKLLQQYQLKTLSSDISYFWVLCNEKLAFLTQCQLNNKLYGRAHKLIRADNNQWVAEVTEILV